MIAARRPNTSGRSRNQGGADELAMSYGGRPNTANAGGGGGKKLRMTKEQQANTNKRLAGTASEAAREAASEASRGEGCVRGSQSCDDPNHATIPIMR